MGPCHNTFLRTLDSWKVASVYRSFYLTFETTRVEGERLVTDLMTKEYF